jgi:hypothetical protein
MSESTAVASAHCAPSLEARLPEAMRIARAIVSNPFVSQDVRAIAASVIRRHGFPLKLDS